MCSKTVLTEFNNCTLVTLLSYKSAILEAMERRFGPPEIVKNQKVAETDHAESCKIKKNIKQQQQKRIKKVGIIIHGLHVEANSKISTVELVQQFFKNKLEITDVGVENASFMGKKIKSPIFVKLKQEADRRKIYRNIHRLKKYQNLGFNYIIQDFLSKEELEVRKEQVIVYKKLKNNNENVKFRGAKLLVNNQYLRNLNAYNIGERKDENGSIKKRKEETVKMTSIERENAGTKYMHENLKENAKNTFLIEQTCFATKSEHDAVKCSFGKEETSLRDEDQSPPIPPLRKSFKKKAPSPPTGNMNPTKKKTDEDSTSQTSIKRKFESLSSKLRSFRIK